MNEKQFELILAVFEDEAAATNAYKALHKAEEEKKIDLENVVVISKEVEGKIHVKETAEEMSGEVGIGALVGGALGILAGPVGIITFGAMGAALGGLSAKLDDVGFDDRELERLGGSLQPGESAILAVLDSGYADLLAEKLEARGARIAREVMPKDFGKLLEKESGWAYFIAGGEAEEAAAELGLIEPEEEDNVTDVDEQVEDPSAKYDQDEASPKL
jgi:uncharacterized membrane protein